MTEQEHVENVKLRAQELADALTRANDDGVSQALLLPALIGVFREAGMMPAGFGL